MIFVSRSLAALLVRVVENLWCRTHRDITTAMTSHKNALFLLGLCLWTFAITSSVETSVSQASGSITVNAGRTATLQCFHDGSRQFLLWFKQSLGREPRLISTFYAQRAIFQPDFEKERRFSVDSEGKSHHLTIGNLRASDAATYYCASKRADQFTFGNGTVVDVSAHPGESATCTVQTGSCAGQHSVHWFRGSGQTHPGLVYTEGGSSERCGSNRGTANAQPHTCAYHVKHPRRSQADADCAVAACGLAVFQIGSTQRTEHRATFSDSLVTFLIALLTTILIPVVLFAVLLAKLQRREKCCCKNPDNNSPPDRTPDARQEDNLNYAALKNLHGTRSTRQTSINVRS